MDFCSPIGRGRVARAIEMMGLSAGSRVVDFGAGKCVWLAAILSLVPGSKGTGVEPARVFADEARRRYVALIESGRLEIVECPAAQFLEQSAGARFDAALCIGSTHAFGDYEKALGAIVRCVKGGGVVAVAEGYWRNRPDREYLKVLGGDESAFTSHAGNIERAMSRGLTPLWCSTVTGDEWDEYEWGYSRGIESWVRAHPDDPDAEAMTARSRAWRDAYVKWGRETLGFGVYVLRRAGGLTLS
jgi:ubiquinone/menaquinone biosynthesis C-methylase UbiE